MKETLPMQLARLDVDRTRGYKELLDFYYGRQWEGRERRGERRLIFNYAKVFTDKVASYLMSGIHFAVDAAEDSAEARDRARQAEEVLYEVYEENNLEQLDLETEIDCAVLGDACYKVIWDAVEKRVRVTAPDVQGIYAWGQVSKSGGCLALSSFTVPAAESTASVCSWGQCSYRREIR